MAADAEIQNHFKAMAQRYENIQHNLNQAFNASKANLRLYDNASVGKTAANIEEKPTSTNYARVPSIIGFNFPSITEMKDLFNDPKEKFKLKRTSISRKPKRKNRKQSKEEKTKASSNVDNQGYDTRIPKSRKGSSTYARSTTRGWQSELEQLGEKNVVKYSSSILQQDDVEKDVQYDREETIRLFLSQNGLSKTRIAKLIQQLWGAVHHVKKVNNYYVTGADFLKVLRVYAKDRSNRPSLEEKLLLAFGVTKKRQVSHYTFVFFCVYYNDSLTASDKIEMLSTLCAHKVGATNVLQQKQVSMRNVLALIFGNRLKLLRRQEKSVSFMRDVQLLGDKDSITLEKFSDMIKADASILKLFYPSKSTKTYGHTTSHRAIKSLKTFMERRQLTWSSLNSLWKAISSIAEHSNVDFSSKKMLSSNRNVWQERSYLHPDDFNKTMCIFLEPSEPRDGKLVRDVSTNYINQNDFSVDCWALVSDLATSLNQNDDANGALDMEAKIRFYFNLYDLDGNGDIDQEEFQLILMSHQSSIEKMSFLLLLELYGLTKNGNLLRVEKPEEATEQEGFKLNHWIDKHVLLNILTSSSPYEENFSTKMKIPGKNRGKTVSSGTFFDFMCRSILANHDNDE